MMQWEPIWQSCATCAFERLAILLRLAVILHRSRSPDPLPELHLSAAKKSIELRFPEGWLDQHPLTRADLETETVNLRPANYTLDVSETGGR